MLASLRMIPGSSMVEQEAVNFEVTGSSPVRGANQKSLRQQTFLIGANRTFYRGRKA